MLRQVRMRETEKRGGKNFYLCRQYLKKDYLVLKVLMNICIKQCTLLPFLLIITVCLTVYCTICREYVHTFYCVQYVQNMYTLGQLGQTNTLKLYRVRRVGWGNLSLFVIFEKRHNSADHVYF